MRIITPSPNPSPWVRTDGGSHAKWAEPLGRGHALTMMIRSKRAPALTQATPPGGELRFHRTNRKVSEGALGDHLQDVVIALERSLSLFIKAVQTPEGGLGLGCTEPLLPAVGTARLCPVLENDPRTTRAVMAAERGGALLAQNIPNGE